jgi:hypothetical protein
MNSHSTSQILEELASRDVIHNKVYSIGFLEYKFHGNYERIAHLKKD